MDIVKKNIMSIVCGVIALAGIVILVTWVSSQRADLQKRLDQRKATYDALLKVQNQPRHLPIVSLGPDAQPEDLKHFPNPKIIEAGKAGVKGLADQSLALKRQAVALNRHKLLVPGSLPTPLDAFAFVRAYNAQFNPKNPQSIPALLDAATPPTDSEIQARQEQRQKELTDKAPRGADGEILAKDLLDQQIQQMQAQLPEQMKVEAATKHKMYMAPDALAQQPDLAAGSGATPDANKIWFAQVMLWVEQDVAGGIRDLNQSSRNVEHSPVKQLVSLAVAPDDSMYAMPSGPAAGAAPAVPQAYDPRAAAVSGASPDAGPASNVPTNADTDPLPKDYTVSPTGRACNGVFDVVHFTLVLKVESSQIPAVINGLERGRLLCVYQTDVQSVNSAAEAQQGYLLGGSPVAQITLQCEELFLRDWTRPLMPPYVQSLLNVQAPQAAGGQPAASIN